jgi:hypothetical protein
MRLRQLRPALTLAVLFFLKLSLLRELCAGAGTGDARGESCCLRKSKDPAVKMAKIIRFLKAYKRIIVFSPVFACSALILQLRDELPPARLSKHDLA